MITAVRRLAAVGPLAPAAVWDRYADLSRWAEWAPQIVEVEADRTALAVGVRGVVHAVGGLEVPFVVTAVDPVARTWGWIARPLGLTLSLSHTVQRHLVRADPNGTRATLAVEGSWPVATAYAPLAFLALRRLVH